MWHELGERLLEILREAITFVVDGLYLAVWIWVQFKVDERFIHPLHLEGIEHWTMEGFRVILAISSLVPPICRIYRDVRVAIIRSQRAVREEQQRGGVP